MQRALRHPLAIGLFCLVLPGGACSAPKAPARAPARTVEVPAAEAGAEEPREPGADGSEQRKESAGRPTGGIPECKLGTREDLTEARRAFQAGVEAFGKGEIETAQEAFLSAYAHSCKLTVLYNVGVAREQLGDYAGALEAFEAFAKAEPAPASLDEVKRRIDELRARLGR